MEKLAERHQLVLAKETVRRIQIAAGFWIPRKLRPPKIQQLRTRRACVGELSLRVAATPRLRQRRPAAQHTFTVAANASS